MLAIIPARLGSKGLNKKNIKLFCGKPLIAWTILEAKKSKLINRVIVSTESDKIAKIAEKYGAEVPFLRPKKLAEDNSRAIDNYTYTMKRLKKSFNISNDNFVVLQPTSPLRNSNDIDKAIKIYDAKKADSVIACTETDLVPFAMFNLDKNASILLKKDSKIKKFMNRQEEKKFFTPNGSIYVLNYKNIINYNSYFSKKTLAYIMPKNRSIDINDINDFNLAKYYKNKN